MTKTAHIGATKDWVIQQIRMYDAATVLGSWDGDDESAIQAVRDLPTEYVPTCDCEPRTETGRCPGWPTPE